MHPSFEHYTYGILLLVIGTIVLMSIRFIWYSRHSVRLGKTTRRFSSTPTHPEIRILLIGDSTLYGTGCTDAKNSIAGRIHQDYPLASITNESENGMTLRRLLKKIATIDLSAYDLILVQVGGMDVLKLTPLFSVRNMLTELGTMLTHTFSGTVMCISVNNTGVPPLMHAPFTHFFDRRSRTFSELWQTWSKEHSFIHVPLYRSRDTDPLYALRTTHFAIDRMHPNDNGYALWYSDIKTALDKHLRHGHTPSLPSTRN